MSTVELAKKIESLSADDYNLVIMLVNSLSEKNINKNMKKYSEDELVAELTESIRKSDNGDTVSAKELSKKMRERYAI